MGSFPRLYLAVDNCFASKRWTRPAEWMELIASFGVNYVETSADTECDPLYLGREYLAEWQSEVRGASARYGVEVANLYSGHGTYATLGLAHTDPRVGRRFLDEWLKPMVDLADRLGAGLGFYCHAFSEAVLQDPVSYRRAEAELIQLLSELSGYAGGKTNIGEIGVEQMYTPHQIPWRIRGARELLKEIYARSGAPFYTTVDVGHQSGQAARTAPDAEEIARELEKVRRGAEPSLWLGSDRAAELLHSAASASPKRGNGYIAAILRECEQYPHLFASPEDADPYAWLEALGGWSPIIHLQQTDGRASAHRPFDAESNATGIITGDRVLKALYRHYLSEPPQGMPPRADKLYLTLEIFASTAAFPARIRRMLTDSVAYWRRFLPEDGMPLDTLMERMGTET